MIISIVSVSLVLEHRPSQQGLRLACSKNFKRVYTCTRASSITTRIETWRWQYSHCLGCCVLEHRPSQQGLRPRISLKLGLSMTGTRASSSTIRIETSYWYLSDHWSQGTRASSSTTRIEPFVPFIIVILLIVLEHRPSQQGLRLP